MAMFRWGHQTCHIGGGKLMNNEELLELQKETIETLKEYLGNLIPGMQTVAGELKGEIKEDTWEYLRMILDGFNWVIEAYNGVRDCINKESAVVDDKSFDAGVKKLSDAYVKRNGEAVADALEGEIIPVLEAIKNA